MQVIWNYYLGITIKNRLIVLCLCYSACIVAATIAGTLDSRLLQVGASLLFISLGAMFGGINIWAINSSIGRTISNLETLAQGDLSQEIVIKRNNEVSKILFAMRNMVAKLTEVLRNIHGASLQMEQSSFQIAEISNEISQASNAQQQRAGDVSAATGEVHRISESVRELSETMLGNSRQTEQEAEQGLQATRENIAQMRLTVTEVNRASEETAGLNRVGEQIHSIIEGITDIADQTNLLALNAAIEAARAGEQGRGFAVVADEVRNLASRTSGQTREITKIINDLTDQVARNMETMARIVERVRDGEQKTLETAQIIEKMVASVQQASSANLRISEASKSQMDRLLGLQQSQESLFYTIQDNGSKVAVTATISEDLNQVTKEFNRLLGNFTFRTQTAITPSENEHRLHPRAQNGLLVMVHQAGTQPAVKGITGDFSMTGVQLRLSGKGELQPGSAVGLDIMTPYNSLEEYERQTPLKVNAQVVWCRRQGNGAACGLKFEELDREQRRRLEACFEHFKKNASFGQLQAA